MSIAGFKEHFAGWREWELNPIVIKELRQAVRSWTVTGMLLLFLTVLFITSLVFLITHLFETEGNLGLGAQMFAGFMVILAAASVFFIPLYVGIRVAMERQENNPDLLYVSTLSPGSIILGKFFCGAYMALLFFSACMPFMAFTNLLRGVDLPTVLFILFGLFLVVCAANMVAIFLACLPVSRPFKVLLALYGLIQSGGMVLPLVGLSYEFLNSGVGAMLFGRSFWFAVFSFIGIILAIIGLFFVLSVALISPPSSNRALAVRIYVTAVWILSGILGFAWVVRSGDAERILAWSYPTLVLMILALLVTISNSDKLSLRVQRTIPRSGPKRALAFVFFNGAAGGLVWVTAVLFGTYFFTGWILTSYPKTAGGNGQLFSTMVAYALDYALLALLIHRAFLSKRPPKIVGILAVLLAGAWAITPSIFLFFLNRLSWKTVERAPLGNPFSVFAAHDDAERANHLWFAFAWLIVMIVLNARWFSRQTAKFHPPPAIAPPVIE